jgi:hypothetical protein
MRKINISFLFIKSLFFLPIFLLFSAQFGWAIPDEEIRQKQGELQGKTVGEKIAFWTERFVGTPYDEDPLGEYVTKATIVADERVDCMYLTFRAVELALSKTPEEAIQIALEKRFHSRGVLQDGRVINYEDRFDYGEDMIPSGKWGRDVTGEFGRTIRIKGSRGRDFYEILPPQEIKQGMKKLQSGDIFFFMTRPEKRKGDEAVGHIGIIKIEGNSALKEIYLIHAGGSKNKGGSVKKVFLQDYISRMPFVGVIITRIEEGTTGTLEHWKNGRLE